MATERNSDQVHIVCDECTFSRVVTDEGTKSADVILDHGRKTGHKLTVEEADDGR